MAAGWVHDTLPVGSHYRMKVCGTCAQDNLSIVSYGFLEGFTRSAEPDPQDGCYLVQPHHDWCPVLTGRPDPLGCPRCGADIVSLESSPGMAVKVPSGALVGTGVQGLGDPDVEYATEPARRVAELDEVTLRPCGHTLQGSDAHQALARSALKAAQRRDELTDMVLAADGSLLAAARTAGHGVVVDAYETAVRAGLREACGLRAALLLLCPADAR